MRVAIALTSVQARQYQQAFERLRSGRTDDALAMAQALAAAAPEVADAQQLLAMCLAQAGQHEAADGAFRRALSLAPGSGVISLNYAGWLRRVGRPRDALTLLMQAPPSAATWIQQGLVALDLQEPARSEQAFARALALEPEQVTAWHGLGNARQARGALASAADAFEKATALAPGYAPAWVNLGCVQRLLGRLDAALASFEVARGLGHDSVDFSDMVNGTLLDAGQVEQAMQRAAQLVREHPASAQAHDTFARIRWEHAHEPEGAPDPFADFRAAVAAQPDHHELALRYIRLLLAAGEAAEASARIASMQRTAPQDPVLDWLAGDACGRLGDWSRAAAHFARAHRTLAPVSPDFLNAHARHAFRSGRPDLARACAEQALRLRPFDQEAWSHLGTAWRIAGDPREEWLFGYEHLVGDVEVALPEGPSGAVGFLDALAAQLDVLHSARRAPLEQSVRQGSQTSGRLFGGGQPLIAAIGQALHEAVERWTATLPDDPSHPFLARRRHHARMVGSWSVKLWSSGRHANHIHQEGWLSSAFYVALPGVMDGAAPGHAGWLQLGQPMEELGLDLPPRRLLRPRQGRLALFPSYMWHGTVPFEDQRPRMTIAFDMQPDESGSRA